MSRRALGLAAALLVAAAGCEAPSGSRPSGGTSNSLPRRSSDRPNVLIMMTDDQRLDGTLGVLPQTMKLFRNGGVEFTNAVANTPLCCPSRASLLSGRYAHNHGVTTNNEAKALDHKATLPTYLQGAGYQTAMAGKFLNGWDVRGTPPPGFDRFSTFYGGYYDRLFNTDGRLRQVRGYSVDFLAGRAVRYLRAFETDDEAPWFLYLTPPTPHSPYLPAQRYEHAVVGAWRRSPAVSEEDLSDKPPYVRGRSPNLDKTRRLRAAQLRVLMAFDDLVRRLFRVIRRLGEDEDTLAIYLSDNGFNWAEHGLPLKRAPYMDSVRVPFFVRWPGYLKPGTTDDRLVGIVDIAPTVLDASGTQPDQVYPLDGRSLFEEGERDRIHLEHYSQPETNVPEWASTLGRGWQYIESYDDSGATVEFREYYDLLSDPYQLDNLLATGGRGAPDDAELVELGHQLDADRACVGGGCP